MALARVKSLTERNHPVFLVSPCLFDLRIRYGCASHALPGIVHFCSHWMSVHALGYAQAISKLSRLSTASPSHAGRTGSSSTRSPNPPNSASSFSSTSTSSHRSSAHSKSYSSPYTRASASFESGSETEREEHSLRSYPSSEDLSVTPPSTFSGSSQTRPSSGRPRRVSAPTSPDRDTFSQPSSSRPSPRNASPGPSRTPRKRVSIASSSASSSSRYDDEERDDVASAALAAIGVRRSPTISSSSRSRQPLPREFRDTVTSRRSVIGESVTQPSTPNRNRDRGSFLEARGSPSPTSAGSTLNLNGLQHSPRPPRASAGRSVRELSRRRESRWMSEDISSTSHLPDINDGEESDLNAAISPSGLIYGKRQTLRGGSAESALGGRSLVGQGLKAAGIGAKRRESSMDLFRDDSLDREGPASLLRARTTGSSGRTLTSGNVPASEGAGPLAKTRSPLEVRTTAPMGEHRHRMSMSSRPSTSMAGYSQENPPRTAPPTLRTYRSSVILPERERSGTEMPLGSRHQSAILSAQDRMYSSPVTAHRQTPSVLSGQLTQQNTEHTRLMLESLSMFESSLSRLPPMGTTTTSTIPDLFRSAQTIVHSTEKLNALLRAGTANALERQIGADVDDDTEQAGVRLSELWRSVGGDFRESMRMSDELVRTLTGFLLGVGKVLRDSASTANAGLQHLRTGSGSYDDETVTRRITPEATRRISDGRASVDSRRSWEDAPRDIGRQPSSRASSSLRRTRESEEATDMIDPEDDLPDPSPTPAARYQGRPLRAVPPALSTVPSESIIQRQASSAPEPNRRKISNNSNATVRAGAMPSTLKTPSAITALTPHSVSNSPEKPAVSLPRVDSSGSGGSRASVIFSRPSNVSLSTLNGMQDRARKRTISATSSTADEALEAVLAADREARSRTVGATGRVARDSVERRNAGEV
ncbi:hypothetical protein OE88DRAFT_1392677 [Heliocybe sulcata]|uniref:Uncharacterized protein n=1 Tax=Heliocybe sulcata TaxID=5364 RepID=A0A5C3N7A9_9AGAM|nr:hypothetical protein OE88DRAFT_1392677 [Heliocybe sulcata]